MKRGKWRWISLRTLTRGRLVPRQPWAIKRTTRTELRDETCVGVAWLIIKGKIIYGKSSCDLPYFTQWNDAKHFAFNYQRHHHPQLTPKQPPPFQRVITPLSLRRGAGGEAERRWCLGFVCLILFYLSLSTTPPSHLFHLATALVLCYYPNGWISQYKCPHGATRYELFFW